MYRRRSFASICIDDVIFVSIVVIVVVIAVVIVTPLTLVAVFITVVIEDDSENITCRRSPCARGECTHLSIVALHTRERGALFWADYQPLRKLTPRGRTIPASLINVAVGGSDRCGDSRTDVQSRTAKSAFSLQCCFPGDAGLPEGAYRPLYLWGR